jgi:hypothetical protein
MGIYLFSFLVLLNLCVFGVVTIYKQPKYNATRNDNFFANLIFITMMIDVVIFSVYIIFNNFPK